VTREVCEVELEGGQDLRQVPLVLKGGSSWMRVDGVVDEVVDEGCECRLLVKVVDGGCP
jgi:hypothetical protein